MIAALFRREVLLGHPFDPNMKHSAEDMDLCLRLGQDGHVFGVTRAYAYHRHRREFSAFAKRCFRFGLGNSQLALKYKSLGLMARPIIAVVGAIPNITRAKMLRTIPYEFIGAFVCFSGTVIGLSEARRSLLL
jgi:cellulose synthase/poly-beta-1,6-N-acetylglucosamine synthase-like glycosyltransferase